MEWLKQYEIAQDMKSEEQHRLHVKEHAINYFESELRIIHDEIDGAQDELSDLIARRNLLKAMKEFVESS